MRAKSKAVDPTRAQPVSQKAIPPSQSAKPDHIHSNLGRFRIPLIGAGIAVAVLVLYTQSVEYDFITLDDQEYVADNAHVLKGVTWENVSWAFTSGYASNWHPLTWLSHMLDTEMFGPKRPGGPHLVNAILHAVSAVILFFAIRELTQSLWPSVFVAVAFAIHPLRVESVAWISERKDVLSGLFFMLTLLAYAKYAQRPSKFRYLLVCLPLALGLMAKPSLVTTPFVLLLLDYWPLRRLRTENHESGHSTLRWLILEKLPMFALVILTSVATVQAQSEIAIRTFDEVTMVDRLKNAVFSYVVYLIDFLFPWNLAVFYPIHAVADWKWITSAIVLLAISVWAVASRRERPYLLVGWLWYLGMLVPMIGLVQVGIQARADRYTYLSQIGLLIALSMGMADLASTYKVSARSLAIVASLVCVFLACLTWRQVQFWRDSSTLYRQTLACTHDNEKITVAHGVNYLARKKYEEAAEQFRNWVAMSPNNPDAWKTYGLTLGFLQKWHESAFHLKRSLEIRPTDAETLTKYGDVLYRLQKWDDAVAVLEKAVQADPGMAEAHLRLGFVLESQEKYSRAIDEFQEVLAITPDSVAALYHMGDCYYQVNRPSEAMSALRRALALTPDDPEMLQLAAMIAATSEDDAARSGPDALRWINRLFQLIESNDPLNFDILAAAYAECGQFADAIAAAERALELASVEAEQLRLQNADTREIKRADKWLAEIRAHLKLVQSGKPIRTVLAKK